MPELDHLIFASPDLSEGVRIIDSFSRQKAVPGGPHVNFGTENYLLTFNDKTYFEIIGIDRNQEKPTRPRPFGIDTMTSPALVGYAIHPTANETLEDVVALKKEANFDPGQISEMSRVKPEGETKNEPKTKKPQQKPHPPPRKNEDKTYINERHFSPYRA